MKKLWFYFFIVVFLSFSVLGYAGFEIYQKAPPIPSKIIDETGKIITTQEEIKEGQNVWQAMGGMEVGSIWGHGSYVAPDWTADWIHKEATYILDKMAQKDFTKNFQELNKEQQAMLKEEYANSTRKNTYNQSNGEVVVSSLRAEAYNKNLEYYSNLFSKGKSEYAIPAGSVINLDKLKALSAFFFWTAWSAETQRFGENVTYTGNWPYEPLVNNTPSSDAIVWTGISVLGLIFGTALMVWVYASKEHENIISIIKENPLLSLERRSPSQLAVIKYFWIVAILILVQISLGIITAHYGVEGNGLYGIPIDQYLPYSVVRTWHTQIGIFWIATSWLAAGLYLAPIISGYEPKFQKLGVNILFSALLLVVAGSLTGEWLSVKNKLTGDLWFYFGHQGYEYVDLGRVWQIGLLTGLFLWLFLMARCILVAIKKDKENKSLLTLFLISTICIAAFYSAGLMWHKSSHLSMVEYWRWWVVHLWVEGFFEIFAVSVISLLFVKMGLIKSATANKSVIFSSTIFLGGGIIGTLHHLYFTGTPTMILSLGAVFSALEVVPLTLVGFEAMDNLKILKANDWMKKYKIPVYFFVAVAFWNMLGAGVFGFMINPPIALYYMQGLNTTPVHGHTALFGVYGMLGIGLTLFCLRTIWLDNKDQWNEKIFNFSFWSLNYGLLAMVMLSLLPVGIFQVWASIEKGYWYARSSEFLYSPMLQIFKWLRVPGDIIFAFGCFALVIGIFILTTKKPINSLEKNEENKKEVSIV
ncbi:MAG: nitric-oxide reductase large subunit [Candidatus Sericytochromatia bacterium]